MSKIKFKIKELDIKQTTGIATQWLKANASADDIDIILLWTRASNCSCISVEDEQGEIYALFDIWEAPAHIKNMKVCFSPKHSFDLKGQKYSEFIDTLDKLINVLISIFNYVVKLSDKWGVVKIYNANPLIGLIFADFAKELKRKTPDYGVKLYRNWVEITNPSKQKGKGVGQ